MLMNSDGLQSSKAVAMALREESCIGIPMEEHRFFPDEGFMIENGDAETTVWNRPEAEHIILSPAKIKQVGL